jgi:hypothetical protein
LLDWLLNGLLLFVGQVLLGAAATGSARDEYHIRGLVRVFLRRIVGNGRGCGDHSRCFSRRGDWLHGRLNGRRHGLLNDWLDRRLSRRQYRRNCLGDRRLLYRLYLRRQ